LYPLANQDSIPEKGVHVKTLDVDQIAATWRLHELQPPEPIGLQGYGSQGVYRLAAA
jgi:hypothetical protein